MKSKIILLLLIAITSTIAVSQSRRYEIHKRGMLHQTVFNTGEIGRAYDNGSSGSTPGVPSFEWPANSALIVDGKKYNGQYNSIGAGFYILGYKKDTCYADQCGAVSDLSGRASQVVGVFSEPISITRIENYPVLENGNLNPNYNPDEAEEIIISEWKAINTGVTVKRTSRAWSYPDYDDFIIYEYEIKNPKPTDPSVKADTLKDVIVAWGYGFITSMFGYERMFNRWREEDTRSKDQFARYDLKRYMTYHHDRDGKPDDRYFNVWAPTGKYGGGLNSPQAAGVLSLFYEYNQLAQRIFPLGVPQLWTKAFFDIDKFTEIFEPVGARQGAGRMKQPYINRYENGNLYATKIGVNGFLDCRVGRKSTPFGSSAGTYPTIGSYWIGRASPSWTIGSRQPAVHIYGFGPYNILPDSTIRFSIAEVVGYGAGVASDTVYQDLGGGVGSDGTDPAPGTHPVPSWYREISYPEAKTPGSTSSNMGSNYLQNYPLPSYVNSNVVSIRDVADRAIQLYTGRQLVKYDTVQYEPKNAPQKGVYKVKIPIPAPAITVENADDAQNVISWNDNVESFTTPRLNAPFSYYEVKKASHPLGPWTLMDSVGKGDSRYYNNLTRTYRLKDRYSLVGQSFYYTVISVDTLGYKSGMTNMTLHQTQISAANPMSKVYVVPNPLILSSGSRDASIEGDINDRIQFFGLPKRATIRIFSYSGQLINTINHDINAFTTNWYQVTRNNQRLASGVYVFVVEDIDTGKRAWNKFVIIH